MLPAITRHCKLESPFSQFVNHCSINATAYIDSNDLWLKAKSKLEVFTEITVDYNGNFGFIMPNGRLCKLVKAQESFRKY